MFKLSRRQLLRASLAAGALLTATHVRKTDALQLPQSRLTAQFEPAQLELANQPLRPNRDEATSGYDRQISGLLVRCCDLAVEQYQWSRSDANFDGSIRALAEYREYAPFLEAYTQVASFRVAELDFSSTATAAAKANPVALSIEEVFFGYALTSDTGNIIALRSSQTETEWITNIAAQQANFMRRQPEYGQVHAGFQFFYERLTAQIRRVVEQFDSSLPCYITGYSLGSAVAVLAAANLALDSDFENQIQVYTYAAPKVGDPTFARFYNRLVPRTYRIVNQADLFTTVPPEFFDRKTYSHVGQEWSYLSQLGSVIANHAISTYRNAIDAGIEISQSRR